VVKTLVKLMTALLVSIVTGRVLVLEVAAVIMLAVAAGIWWGLPAVLVVVGVATLLKSAELDVASPRRRGGS
jgi:hypothetical protein